VVEHVGTRELTDARRKWCSPGSWSCKRAEMEETRARFLRMRSTSESVGGATESTRFLVVLLAASRSRRGESAPREESFDERLVSGLSMCKKEM